MTFRKEFVLMSIVTFASVPNIGQVNGQWLNSETFGSLNREIPTLFKVPPKRTFDEQYGSNYFQNHRNPSSNYNYQSYHTYSYKNNQGPASSSHDQNDNNPLEIPYQDSLIKNFFNNDGDIKIPSISEIFSQDGTEQDDTQISEEQGEIGRERGEGEEVYNQEDESDKTSLDDKSSSSVSKDLKKPNVADRTTSNNPTNNGDVRNQGPDDNGYIGFSFEAAMKENDLVFEKVSYKKCIEYTGSRGAVGGRDAVLGEFPHMGAIGWPKPIGGYAFKCGGSLISEKFILTAAHCLKASPRDTDIISLDPAVVRLGEQNIFTDDDGAEPIDYSIKRTIPHPDYRSPKKYHDIGLIELVNEVVTSKHVRPACLSTGDHFGNGRLLKEAIITGWGATREGSRDLSPVLQKVYVNILDTRRCDELLKKKRNRLWQGLTDQQVCAGVLQGGKDACQGDSGGPLQRTTGEAEGARFTIVGVTSFGVGCGNKNLPGVYARVYSYTNWIESVVWPGE